MIGRCFSTSPAACWPSLTSSASEYLFSGGVMTVCARSSAAISSRGIAQHFCKNKSGLQATAGLLPAPARPKRSDAMSKSTPAQKSSTEDTREQLIEHLNQDLSREYQAIIAYVVYSQV